MSAQKMMVNSVDPDGKWLYQVGSISALLFGIGYIIIMALYVPMGAPPDGSEAHLAYVAGNRSLWWAILGLSVLTDFLLVPVALSLYQALKGINRNAMLLAIAFMGLFLLLGLALTWTNYAVLITLSGDYAGATTYAQRAVTITAASYPSTILKSSLLFVYNSLTLSVGILLTGLVMLKGIFSKSTACIGLITGILGVVAVVGSLLISSLGAIIIVASLFTTVWILFVGYGLYRLSQS